MVARLGVAIFWFCCLAALILAGLVVMSAATPGISGGPDIGFYEIYGTIIVLLLGIGAGARFVLSPRNE